MSNKFIPFLNIMLLVILILIQSCEGQQTRRRRRKSMDDPSKNYQDGSVSNTGSSTNNSPVPNIDGSDTATNFEGTGYSSTGGTQGGGGNLPQEFAHCNFSNTFKYGHMLIGRYNLCFSNVNNDNRILFQTQLPIRNYKLCFYPTSTNMNSNPVMIGSAGCLFPGAGTQVTTIQLSANRRNFQNKPLNGVMIIRQSPYGEPTASNSNYLVTTYTLAYEDCMLYWEKFGDFRWCQIFINKGQYIYHQF